MSRAVLKNTAGAVILASLIYWVGCGGSQNPGAALSQNSGTTATPTAATGSTSSNTDPAASTSQPSTPTSSAPSAGSGTSGSSGSTGSTSGSTGSASGSTGSTSGSTGSTSGSTGSNSGSTPGQTASILPTPPANATVFSNLQSVPLTGDCNASSCAGGSGSGSYFDAMNQTTPSLSGASLELDSAGVDANTLFYWHNSTDATLVGSISHFLEDFWVYTDNTAGVQAFEYDPDWYVDGYKFDMSLQCDYADGNMWRLWNSANNQWVAVSPTLPCGWSVNTWHHVQLYTTGNLANHTYTYQALVIDGNATVLNATYSALNNGWGPTIGTEAQLDGNSSGIAIHEWIDQMTLTVW